MSEIRYVHHLCDDISWLYVWDTLRSASMWWYQLTLCLRYVTFTIYVMVSVDSMSEIRYVHHLCDGISWLYVWDTLRSTSMWWYQLTLCLRYVTFTIYVMISVDSMSEIRYVHHLCDDISWLYVWDTLRSPSMWWYQLTLCLRYVTFSIYVMISVLYVWDTLCSASMWWYQLTLCLRYVTFSIYVMISVLYVWDTLCSTSMWWYQLTLCLRYVTFTIYVMISVDYVWDTLRSPSMWWYQLTLCLRYVTFTIYVMISVDYVWDTLRSPSMWWYQLTMSEIRYVHHLCDDISWLYVWDTLRSPSMWWYQLTMSEIRYVHHLCDDISWLYVWDTLRSPSMWWYQLTPMWWYQLTLCLRYVTFSIYVMISVDSMSEIRYVQHLCDGISWLYVWDTLRSTSMWWYQLTLCLRYVTFSIYVMISVDSMSEIRYVHHLCDDISWLYVWDTLRSTSMWWYQLTLCLRYVTFTIYVMISVDSMSEIRYVHHLCDGISWLYVWDTLRSPSMWWYQLTLCLRYVTFTIYVMVSVDSYVMISVDSMSEIRYVHHLCDGISWHYVWDTLRSPSMWWYQLTLCLRYVTFTIYVMVSVDTMSEIRYVHHLCDGISWLYVWDTLRSPSMWWYQLTLCLRYVTFTIYVMISVDSMSEIRYVHHLCDDISWLYVWDTLRSPSMWWYQLTLCLRYVTFSIYVMISVDSMSEIRYVHHLCDGISWLYVWDTLCSPSMWWYQLTLCLRYVTFSIYVMISVDSMSEIRYVHHLCDDISWHYVWDTLRSPSMWWYQLTMSEIRYVHHLCDDISWHYVWDTLRSPSMWWYQLTMSEIRYVHHLCDDISWLCLRYVTFTIYVMVSVDSMSEIRYVHHLCDDISWHYVWDTLRSTSMWWYQLTLCLRYVMFTIYVMISVDSMSEIRYVHHLCDGISWLYVWDTLRSTSMWWYQLTLCLRYVTFTIYVMISVDSMSEIRYVHHLCDGISWLYVWDTLRSPSMWWYQLTLCLRYVTFTIYVMVSVDTMSEIRYVHHLCDGISWLYVWDTLRSPSMWWYQLTLCLRYVMFTIYVMVSVDSMSEICDVQHLCDGISWLYVWDTLRSPSMWWYQLTLCLRYVTFTIYVMVSVDSMSEICDVQQYVNNQLAKQHSNNSTIFPNMILSIFPVMKALNTLCITITTTLPFTIIIIIIIIIIAISLRSKGTFVTSSILGG